MCTMSFSANQLKPKLDLKQTVPTGVKSVTVTESATSSGHFEIIMIEKIHVEWSFF